MTEPIKVSQITGNVYWDLQAQSKRPITPFEIAKMLNLAIKHGIVTPSNSSDLKERLSK